MPYSKDRATAPAVYTVPEAARRLGVSTRHAYRLVATGELPSLRLAGVVRIPIAAVEAMITAWQRP